ncbi:hypothetical protein BSLG_006699 [Batrachochytrium salamandrivorans]|nr:hypothetical protein BSLG_006699 [Batrachochytrium salamandrivorans]
MPAFATASSTSGKTSNAPSKLPPISTSDSVTLCELNRKLLVPSQIQYPGVQEANNTRPLATLPAKSSSPLSTLSRLLESLMFDNQGNFSSERTEMDLIQSIRHIISQITAPIYHFTGMMSAETIHEVMLAKQGSGPIKNLAWHPFKQSVAIVHQNSSVHVFDLSSEVWCPREAAGLHHEFQKNVSSISWNPSGAAALAVGCRDGICLWRFQFDSSITTTLTKRVYPLIPEETSQSPQAWMTFLCAKPLAFVSCLAWSPDGRFLVAGSSADSCIVVFDIATEECEAIKRSGGPTRELRFSPDGLFLLQAFRNGGIRIWETQMWESTLLSTKYPAHSLTWLVDTRLFVFGLEGESRIGMIQMSKDAPCLDTITTPLYRLDGLVPPMTNSKKTRSRHVIRQLCVSPLGKRMLVQVDGCNELALYAIDTKPLPEFSFIGFIRGPSDGRTPSLNETSFTPGEARPECLSFASQFSRGALAGIAWNTGKLSFIPMMFN